MNTAPPKPAALDAREFERAAYDLVSAVGLLRSGFEEFDNSLVRQAVFTQIVVCLKDVAQYLRGKNSRVAFLNDIPQGDITDLIGHLRNAAVHNTSPLRENHDAIVSFVILEHGPGAELVVHGERFINPFPGDLQFFYGRNGIYLHRHLNRFVLEADGKMSALAQANKTAYRRIFRSTEATNLSKLTGLSL